MDGSYMMLLFVLLAVGMTVATAWWIALPLVRGVRSAGMAPLGQAPGGAAAVVGQSLDIQAGAALDVLREQRRDLQREHAAGLLDAAAFDQAMTELELRALSDGQQQIQQQTATPQPRWAWGVMVWLVVMPLAGYLVLGNQTAVEPVNNQPAVEVNNAQALAEMVDGLARRLDEGVGTPSEWAMLARSYLVLENYAGAAHAYERLLVLIGPDDPNAADVQAALVEVRLQLAKP
ncbi:MAG: c-type cytochrome biogenesis protein CcmI [Corticimicrobacter sp.]|uniref:c-type cytochrome biogenesis protein CcmI n=1 Tax=Corticimicrobacter sp. TaxID=2678536 RepID=UPI0032D9F4EB